MVNPKDHRELKCAYCCRILVKDNTEDWLYATKDHVIPKSRNRNGPHKLVWACRLCNWIKADRMPEEWERFMKRNPRWWEHPYYTEKARPSIAPQRNRRISAPPLEVTREFLRRASLRALRKDEPIPLEYDDPEAQKAYEEVYKNHKYLLRVPS